MTLKNLTQMHFGMKYTGMIDMIQATPKALSLETLYSGSPKIADMWFVCKAW